MYLSYFNIFCNLCNFTNPVRKPLSHTTVVQKFRFKTCFLSFSQVLKCEVELMAKMAKTIDGFTQNQTRLAVIIDGLDSCEQDKVLQMLDTVRLCLRYHAQSCI